MPGKWVVSLMPLCLFFCTIKVSPANEESPQETRALVELFTSQGCSSCPPADALAGRLQRESDVLVLSFHVNYWDNLGWKDPFASQSSTDRQYAYESALGERSAFTPQMVVNGTRSAVGSRENEVRESIKKAHQSRFPIQADLAKTPDGSFTLTLAGPVLSADVWELRFVRHAATPISRGENGGRTLDTYNNVTHIRRLGAYVQGKTQLPSLNAPDDGIAVVVQAKSMGAILGVVAN